MKKFVSVILTLMVILGTVFSTSVISNAATISSNKHTANKVVGGQTVYIKSNTGWNTELFGNTYRTKVQVKINDDAFEVYQYNLTTGTRGGSKIQINTYKKSGSSWVYQSGLSGKFNVNNQKYICNSNGSTKTFILPGKGVEYKMVITPLITDSTKVYGDVYKASDIKNITVNITSYGTIKSVA